MSADGVPPVRGPLPPARGVLALAVALGALSLAGGSTAGPFPASVTAAPEPGPANARGPRGLACDGVPIGVADDPHRVLGAHPPGTAYCLAPGTHRVREPLEPQRGDALVGEPGAVLSGAVVLAGWTRTPDGWAASAPLPPRPARHGACLPRTPTCTLVHDVFLDDRRLRRARSPGQVTPGTFHADHRTGTVVVGTDPRGRVVEQALAPSLVRSTEDRVTVRDLVLEKAANAAQTGAVEARQVSPHRTGGHWQVVHNDVRDNHGVGIGIGDHGTVQKNRVRRQGQLGVGVWGRGVRLLDNDIVGNGTAGYDPDWEAGGVKSWKTEDQVLAGNRVHHNRGPGLWSDGGCARTRYARNVVTDNWGAGIQHEISYEAQIVHNRVERNGGHHKGWAWEAGIQVQSSGGPGGIEVAHNVVTDNANAITVVESGDRRTERPAPHGPHLVRNVRVHHNTVTMHPGQSTGLFQDVGDRAVFTRRIRFVANTYLVSSGGEHHFAWLDDHLTWTEWLGPGVRQDPGGLLLLLDGTPEP